MSTSIKENVSLAPYTVYKIGGRARFFVEAKNSNEIEKAVVFASKNKIPFFVIGAGSNVLVSDNGFEGLIIRLSGGNIKIKGTELIIGAGVMMARAVSEAAGAGLTGLEWGIGVPGTIGGSIRGNAGCFGSEIKDIVKSAEFLDSGNLSILKFDNKDCKFSYRDSIFKKNPEWIILSSSLKLKKGNKGQIQNKIKDISKERAGKQNIGSQCCGCIFKNVSWERRDINKNKLLARFPDLAAFQNLPNIPSSFLIDQTGLKKKKIGKVYVSDKHANFFINSGGARAEEVIMLIGLVKDNVYRKFGIQLEEEIQYIGF